MDDSLKYYEENAEAFFNRVHGWDMTPVYAAFLKHARGKTLLDLGCGTGRDARFFTKQGFRVIAVDGSKEMIRMTRRECPEADSRLLDYGQAFKIGEPIDAVWACASLLHLDDAAFERALQNVVADLVPGGVFYIGVKQAEQSESPNDGRTFNYWTAERLLPIASRCGLHLLEQIVEATPRITWLNVYLSKTF